MTVRHQTAVQRHDRDARSGLNLARIGGWLLGIPGAVATFLGAFILLADEEQSVGLGGEWTWKVGEIGAGWSYGLLAGGIVALVAAVALWVAGRNAARAGWTTSRELTDVVLHATAFALVNAFLWLQDLAMGGGLEYAYWVTVPWGVALAVHVGVYYARSRRRVAP